MTEAAHQNAARFLGSQIVEEFAGVEEACGVALRMSRKKDLYTISLKSISCGALKHSRRAVSSLFLKANKCFYTIFFHQETSAYDGISKKHSSNKLPLP